MIPVFMALVGLSISFVLKYYDNIVKLLCSSVSVLLVNSITSYLSGNAFINVYFLVGWLLTLPATYLYYVKPSEAKPIDKNSSSNNSNSSNNNMKSNRKESDDFTEDKLPLLEKDVESNKSAASKHPPSQSNSNSSNNSGGSSRREKFGLGAVLGFLLLFSVMSSTFEMESLEKDKSANSEVFNTCPIFEVPYSDSRSNLRVVSSYDMKYTHQFALLDDFNGNVYVSCPAELSILGPDTAVAKAKPDGDQVRYFNLFCFF